MPEEVVETAPRTEAQPPVPEEPKAADSEVDYRAKVTAQRKVNRDLEAKLNEARELITKLQGEKPENGGPDAEAIRAEAEATANAKVAERIIRTELRAASTGKLNDPNDALKFLDLSQFAVDSDGDVDEEEIGWAIDDLVKRKPYLAAQSPASKKTSFDGGARKETRPDQLSRADLASMNSDQIEAARLSGRLNDMLGIK